MRVDKIIKAYSTEEKFKEEVLKYTGKEIGNVEITQGPTEYKLYKHKADTFNKNNINYKNGIFTLNVQEECYTLFTKKLENKDDIGKECDDFEVYKELQKYKEPDFRMYFNGYYQHEIGYILDALIYGAGQNKKIENLNPRTHEDIENEQKEFFSKKKK